MESAPFFKFYSTHCFVHEKPFALHAAFFRFVVKCKRRSGKNNNNNEMTGASSYLYLYRCVCVRLYVSRSRWTLNREPKLTTNNHPWRTFVVLRIRFTSASVRMLLCLFCYSFACFPSLCLSGVSVYYFTSASVCVCMFSMVIYYYISVYFLCGCSTIQRKKYNSLVVRIRIDKRRNTFETTSLAHYYSFDTYKNGALCNFELDVCNLYVHFFG